MRPVYCEVCGVVGVRMRNANVNSGPALAGGGTVRKSAAVEVAADNEDRQTRGISHCGATLTLVWESGNSANVRRRTGVQWREVGESSEEKEGEPTSSEVVEDDESKEREVEANEVEGNEVEENEAEESVGNTPGASERA